MIKRCKLPISAVRKRRLFLGLLFCAALLLYAGEAFSGQATLSWDAPTTNTDGSVLTDLAGYKIYYGTASGNYSQVINAGNVTSYTIANLTAGLTYYFAATAYDTALNESSDSNEVSKTVPLLPVLTINKNGSGTITSSPAGISCGATCSASYNAGSIVTLTASPNSGSTFTGWSGGGCTGAGQCAFTLNADTTVTATFAGSPPSAAFSGSPLSGTAPLLVNFADSSANSPSSWSWTFGDGYSSSMQNPAHLYKTPGTFTVSLTVTNAGGTGSTTKTNYITVSACAAQPVRIARAVPVYYSTLQNAYNAAVTGDIIQIQAFDFTENLTFNRNVLVTLRGGYDCTYSTNVADTTLHGTIMFSNGPVSFENFDAMQ